MKYKLYKDTEFNNIVGVLKYEDNKTTFIPMVDGNSDYEEYLEWVAEGNTPEEAE